MDDRDRLSDELRAMSGLQAPRDGGTDLDPSEPSTGRWEAAAALRAYLHIHPLGGPVVLSRDDAELRIVQLVLRALATLDQDPADAVAQARQAARAARTEGIRAMEYLAYWTLARTRRITGKPHASALIMTSCARAVPASWHPLVDWELVLAGNVGEEALERPLSVPAREWRAALSAPTVANLDRLRAIPLPPRFALERDVLCSGFDAVAPEHEALAFAMASALGAPAAGTPAVWEVDAHGCRLRWARAAEGSAPVIPMEVGERTIEAITVLARAGAPLPTEHFFERVYGFAFRPGIHGGTLRTLLHRVRSALGSQATVDRSGDCLHLKPQQRFLCPALASAPSLDDRLLRLLASDPGSGAGELSAQVGANLRTVQRALRSLAASGACEARRDGRSVTYAVEDTTFSEPTHFGATPAPEGTTP